MKKIFTFFAALVCTVSMFAVQEKVYFVNAQNWSGTINAYAWAPQNANWPGVAATKEADQIAGYDVYSYSAEAGTYANVIFNNGSKQTPDLVWTAGKYYVRDGWYTKEDAAAKLGQPIEYESVYFVNVDGWANVKIYTWSPEVAGWPGEDMKKEATKLADKEVWSYAVEKGTTFGGMLFNDGNGKQTGDLKLEVGKYFVQDKWYTQEEALAKLNGSSTPENPNPETPVTGAYYVTGTAELVGADKAWDAAAIAMTFDEAAANHTHTFTGLVADLEYKLKVTNGTWEQSWGHAALSEVPAGVTADTDGNVVFTLAEAGDVVVTFNGTNMTITGSFKATETPTPPTPGETKDITVKAKVPATWTDGITAWVWATGSEGQVVTPTQEGEWYVYTQNCAELNIIFRNGADWNGDANQTVDITVAESTCIEITADGATKATYTIVDCEGGTNPENPNPETPVTGAYYVTGTAELVGADKAWDAAAIAMTFDEAAANHTHTFTGLVADLEYKLKVTNGTWEQSWGHAALSEVPAGVTADTDGNVVFTLAEAGDVVVTFNGTNITIAGNFKATGTPVTPQGTNYVLMGVGGDWTTGIALEANPENENEYMLLGQEIAEGDAVKVVTLTDGVATAWCGNVDEATTVSYTIEEGGYGNIILAPGTYDFYYKVATDNIYIAASTPTGVDNIDVEKKAVKVIRDGQMFIIRDNVVYSVLGQVVK